LAGYSTAAESTGATGPTLSSTHHDELFAFSTIHTRPRQQSLPPLIHVSSGAFVHSIDIRQRQAVIAETNSLSSSALRHVGQQPLSAEADRQSPPHALRVRKTQTPTTVKWQCRIGNGMVIHTDDMHALHGSGAPGRGRCSPKQCRTSRSETNGGRRAVRRACSACTCTSTMGRKP
jgi:hypothetical protein